MDGIDQPGLTDRRTKGTDHESPTGVAEREGAEVELDEEMLNGLTPDLLYSLPYQFARAVLERLGAFVGLVLTIGREAATVEIARADRAAERGAFDGTFEIRGERIRFVTELGFPGLSGLALPDAPEPDVSYVSITVDTQLTHARANGWIRGADWLSRDVVGEDT